MNPDNNATLEASKRLAENGIVLETEKHWYRYATGWLDEELPNTESECEIPRPSMAEVWRELPQSAMDKWNDGTFRCWTPLGPIPPISNPNPTDALIELLIWLKEQGKEEV
jgi:hypothetical protein